MPGLKVIAPSTPYNAKGLLRSAISDPNPVIFLENEILYGLKGPVNNDINFSIPIGKANIEKEGKDLLHKAGNIARKAAKSHKKEVKVAASIPPVFGSYKPHVFDSVKSLPILELFKKAPLPVSAKKSSFFIGS